jgi:RNA polymerase sigma-70 factor (ECF subfamily)
MTSPRERSKGDVPAARPAFGVVRSLPFEGDDTALVAALLAGRADAGAAFYDRHVGLVHGLTFRLMGPDGELDDVVHDVFVRALTALHRLRDPASLRGWVVGIAVRTVAIRFQSRSRRRWLRFMAPEDVPEVVEMPPTDSRRLLQRVHTILDEMAPDERIALVLRRVEELSLEDAAAASGMSLATFRRRLARGEAKFLARAASDPELRQWLEPGGPHD